MGKDAASKAIVLTEEAKGKFEECVVALAACGFGAEGPAVETPFVEIEDFGHAVGRLVARAVDEHLTRQHAQHFQQESPCPVCQTRCAPNETPATRDFQTTDGDIPLHEVVCRCPACHRDFFPSASGVED